MEPSPRKATFPLSTPTLDEHIQNMPIPIGYWEINDKNINAIQDALLPYFAMAFTPAPTSGSNLECGLFALAMSYNAARKAFRKPGSPLPAEIPIEMWREWLNSDDYMEACRVMVKSADGYYGDEDAYVQDLQSKNILDENELSCLLDVANQHNETHFQLGVVVAGYRGKWRERGDGTSFLDNSFLCRSIARMSNVKMREGPTLWIFNDNCVAISRDVHNMRFGGLVTHWEGFEINPSVGINNYRVRMIREYGIGAILETDLETGVWFLTEDHEVGDQNRDHLRAFQGSFVRETTPTPDVEIPKGFRYMRNCKGDEGLVPDYKLEKVKGTRKMPTAATDPTPAQLKLPDSVLPPTLPNVKPIEEETVGIPGDTNGGSDIPDVTQEEHKWNRPKKPDKWITQISQDLPHFTYSPFKIFRVIPSAFIFKNPTMESSIATSGKFFRYNNGDFMLDTGRRENLQAVVLNIKGVEGQIPLRRLRALTCPWGFPDELPVAILKHYQVPTEYAEVIKQLKALDIVGITSQQQARETLKARLDARRLADCGIINLYEVIKDYPAAKGYNASFQKGEIVMVGENRKNEKMGKNSACTIVNCEGRKTRIPRGSIKLLQRVAWGLLLNRTEWLKHQTLAEHSHNDEGGGE